MSNCPEIMFVEPFYGGSHKILIDVLAKHMPNHTLVTLSAKKWHWRARCSSLCLMNIIPEVTTEKILFCSSVLCLAELLGIRPDLNSLKKIVYFHENQLIYPVRNLKERDIQYAYNQITTCLAADLVVFNSHFNRQSFLTNIKNIVKIIPDYKPKNIKEKIENKSMVLYFPVDYPLAVNTARSNDTLHIVWPHRWEFDKAPDDFFAIMIKLKHNCYKFNLSVLGETFNDIPDIFELARNELSNEIVHFGYLENKQAYYDVLCSSHVVVSTAKHEFFGVSMLEAAYCGCFPLAPNNLVYPEIYPDNCLYTNLEHLYLKLSTFCSNPNITIEERKKLNIDFNKYDSKLLIEEYKKLLVVK